MTQGAQQAPVSERLALAGLARQAALESHEVASLDSRPPLARTTGGREPVEGVGAIAAPGGGYEITLYVVARPVSLQRLAANLRERVRRSAQANGLGDELYAVNVIVTDVVSDQERR